MWQGEYCPPKPSPDLPPAGHEITSPGRSPLGEPSLGRYSQIFSENFCHHRGWGEPARRARPVWCAGEGRTDRRSVRGNGKSRANRSVKRARNGLVWKFTTNSRIEKITAGPWRPMGDLLQLSTRHRVRSPREGRDAAHRVRGLPARYAPACARLAASASHWHLRSGPLWPASVGELKSPASVPLAGAQRRRGSQCAPQEDGTRQPHARLSPRGGPLLQSPGIADSVHGARGAAR